MKYDELAFLNQQLAGMLKSGIPLEGALRQLSKAMRQGPLREELVRLEADLAQGTPLEEALGRRRLPAFYIAMLRVGAQSQDLPGVLTLLADYYQRINDTWVRLKGLMVYPLIVLVGAFGLSLCLSMLFLRLRQEVAGFDQLVPSAENAWAAVWAAPLLLGLLVTAAAVSLAAGRWRNWLRWRFPGFREASLAQMASALHLLLSRGCNLDNALGLMRQMEGHSVAGRELAAWQEGLRRGEGSIDQFAASSRTFPQLFLWLAADAGQDLAAGFRRAADIYHNRAIHRIDMLLYACLPVSILFLGLMILGQVYPVARLFIALGGLGSDISGD